MDGYRAFPYSSETDYQRMRTLLRETLALSGPPTYCTVGDLDWWRCTADDPAAICQAWLWEDASGELVGFAWPQDGQVDLITHPEHRAVEDSMLAWAEEWARSQSDGAGLSSLRAWGYEHDVPRSMLLRERGYQREELHLVTSARRLDAPVPAPSLPAGYDIRPVGGADEVEERVAVHRDAFAPSRMTVAKHRAVMAAPTYRPDLDLVVVAPDGSFAAYCIIWLDEPNRTGLFEPVGSHSAHRRRGLTKALLHAGQRRLQELGAHTALVSGLGGAQAATRLYESAGFIPLDRCYAWSRQL